MVWWWMCTFPTVVQRMHLHANVVRFERTPFQQSQPPPPTRPGVPMHAWSSNTFHKIGSMWGEVLELGDCKDECFARKSLCIKTNRDDNILEKFKIIVNEKSFVVHAKELFVWSPSFVEVTEADDTHEEGEFIQNGKEGLEKPIHQTNVEEESDIEAISETFFGDQADDLNEFQPDVKSVGSSSHTVESANNVDDQISTWSIENIQKKKESGSILEILEEMTSVGQTMGFSMEGSIKDMERIIDLKGADDVETKAENVSDMEIESLG
nr:RNA-directed DNA polymerase, eukaryota [Tanacetum cinerariifolium]